MSLVAIPYQPDAAVTQTDCVCHTWYVESIAFPRDSASCHYGIENAKPGMNSITNPYDVEKNHDDDNKK